MYIHGSVQVEIKFIMFYFVSFDYVFLTQVELS